LQLKRTVYRQAEARLHRGIYGGDTWACSGEAHCAEAAARQQSRLN